MHLPHAGGRGVRLLQRFEDGVGGDVRLLAAVLRFALSVLHRLPPPRLVLVVRVVLLVLHPEPLGLLHERPLLPFVEKSVRKQRRGAERQRTAPKQTVNPLRTVCVKLNLFGHLTFSYSDSKC